MWGAEEEWLRTPWNAPFHLDVIRSAGQIHRPENAAACVRMSFPTRGHDCCWGVTYMR
jgi:hypothetical protein